MQKPVGPSDWCFWLGWGWDLAMCGDHSLSLVISFLTFHMSIGYIGYVSSQKLVHLSGKKWIVVFGVGHELFPQAEEFQAPWGHEWWVDNDWKNVRIHQGHGWGKKYEIIGKMMMLFYIFHSPRNFALYLFQRLFKEDRQIIWTWTNFEDVSEGFFPLFISGCCSVIRRNGKYFYFTFFFLNYCQVINLSNMLPSPDRTELTNVFTDHCFALCTGVFAAIMSEERGKDCPTEIRLSEEQR